MTTDKYMYDVVHYLWLLRGNCYLSICFLKLNLYVFLLFYLHYFTITTYGFAAFCQHEIKYVMMMMMQIFDLTSVKCSRNRN